eukprot:7699939-Prorocentrum_lima.AAC.1
MSDSQATVRGMLSPAVHSRYGVRHMDHVLLLGHRLEAYWGVDHPHCYGLQLAQAAQWQVGWEPWQ